MSKLIEVVIDKLLVDLDCGHFLGGSRRFGYSTNLSDWDIFIDVPEENISKSNAIYNYLYESGFKLVPEDDHVDYTIEKATLYCFADRIHVLAIYDSELYKELKEEHDKVALFLSNNPILRKVALRFKKDAKISGAFLYKAFRDMERNERCTQALHDLAFPSTLTDIVLGEA